MKIDAGGKLQTRKPPHTPARSTAESEMMGIQGKNRNAKNNEVITQIPLLKPSMLSSRLKQFVIEITHMRVRKVSAAGEEVHDRVCPMETTMAAVTA